MKIDKRITPENEEKEMISLAMKQAKDLLKSGRAPSQIVVHFLKLATQKEKLENEKLKKDLEVANAKIEEIRSRSDMKQMFEDAINAMNIYGGKQPEEDDDDEY